MYEYESDNTHTGIRRAFVARACQIHLNAGYSANVTLASWCGDLEAAGLVAYSAGSLTLRQPVVHFKIHEKWGTRAPICPRWPIFYLP